MEATLIQTTTGPRVPILHVGVLVLVLYSHTYFIKVEFTCHRINIWKDTVPLFGENMFIHLSGHHLSSDIQHSYGPTSDWFLFSNILLCPQKPTGSCIHHVHTMFLPILEHHLIKGVSTLLCLELFDVVLTTNMLLRLMHSGSCINTSLFSFSILFLWKTMLQFS